MTRKRTHTVKHGIRTVRAKGFNVLARANRGNHARGIRLAGNSHKRGGKR